MEGILVPLGLFAAIAVPIIFLARYSHNERMERIRQGITPLPSVPGRKTLLIGLFFLFIGISLLIGKLILGDPELIFAGIIVASPGIALLIYYKITAPDRERVMRMYEQQAAAVNTIPRVSPKTNEEKPSE